VVSADDVESMKGEYRNKLNEHFAASETYKPNKADWLDGRWSGLRQAGKAMIRAAARPGSRSSGCAASG
jgi:2-oxoglutarate dehydrogenase complex dehydrogenase (E1) component-like enzyme